MLGWLDVIPGCRCSSGCAARSSSCRARRRSRWHDLRRVQDGRRRAQRLARHLRPDEPVQAALLQPARCRSRSRDHVPYEDLGLNRDRHAALAPAQPRAGTVGGRIHLPGLLLNAKGDRVAMHSSVETRYPFLDEEVFDFLAKVPPRWKLRGLLRDKYLLRQLAERWLPSSIAWRRKAMFRAPFDSFQLDDMPAVRRAAAQPGVAAHARATSTPQAVTHWRKAFRSRCATAGRKRISIEMGLVGVLATQLWHHTFIDGCLADLPSLATRSSSQSVAHGARSMSPDTSV